MKYILLDGKDIRQDAVTIEKEMQKDENIIFIYTNEKTALYAYIDRLDQEGELPEENQLKLKICYERKGLNLTWQKQGKNGSEQQEIKSISQLIGKLDNSTCHVVVNDDKRSTLAEVVQQLIYIGYPLAKAEIMLRKEEKDYERAERFMKNIDTLDQQLGEALTQLGEIRLNAYDKAYEENQKRLVEVTSACQEMKEQIEKARNRNLKIAVAATKKAGKSVIVNCMIGEEIAPTSLELATPNTCVYMKSQDKSYHLDYREEKFSFDSVKEIYKKIDEEFKKAQEASAEGFSIPDMDIGYVSDKNNFEAYTIYDTPGPDAAGTTHSQHAWETMKKCDVAIFAIDYSKYLTESEEKYLKEIKTQFNEQMKFDSLIFTINKIDTRYQDVNVSKSVTKSIDFIRGRLKDIDPAYNDCAIFATSALQYFNILEAEKICGAELRESTDLYNDLRPLKKKYKEVKAQLSFLDAQAGYMESESELDNITLENLRQYSGMPDLLEYVAYIAKTKARNELVNSVAYKIDSAQTRIRGIIGWIENLRKLMDENDEEIGKISQIFKRLEERTEPLLSCEITEEDIKNVEEGGKKGSLSSLRIYQSDFKKRGKTFSFQEIEETEKEKIMEAFRRYDSIDNGQNAYELFYQNLRKNYWNAFREAQNEKKILYKEKDWFENGMVSDTVLETRESIVKREFEKSAAGTMTKLNDECNDVLNNRLLWLRQEIDNCKEELQKINCAYTMPDIPSFDVISSKLPQLENMTVTKENLNGAVAKLDVLYKKTNVFENIREFFKDPENYEWEKEKRTAKKVGEAEFNHIFSGARSDIESIARAIGLSNRVRKDGEQMADQMKQNISHIREHFSGSIGEFANNIKTFTQTVDDREKYKDDTRKLEAEEGFIYYISNTVSEFLDSWQRIVNPVEDSEELI